ncbi:MAG: hypothetical protein EZS28_042935 [Streblomastix strix]|uniref:Uncharacterized protein n=1 Tax=Streblomastix strix TaxID=222440 RepID=A0A5J4TUJ9_9EUKA|nr:MAG: hypothetical protein EZS28_042935 [Streblomastix strix]
MSESNSQKRSTSSFFLSFAKTDDDGSDSFLSNLDQLSLPLFYYEDFFCYDELLLLEFSFLFDEDEKDGASKSDNEEGDQEIFDEELYGQDDETYYSCIGEGELDLIFAFTGVGICEVGIESLQVQVSGREEEEDVVCRSYYDEEGEVQ